MSALQRLAEQERQAADSQLAEARSSLAEARAQVQALERQHAELAALKQEQQQAADLQPTGPTGAHTPADAEEGQAALVAQLRDQLSQVGGALSRGVREGEGEGCCLLLLPGSNAWIHPAQGSIH